jgi:hypothetical protein
MPIRSPSPQWGQIIKLASIAGSSMNFSFAIYPSCSARSSVQMALFSARFASPAKSCPLHAIL